MGLRMNKGQSLAACLDPHTVELIREELRVLCLTWPLLFFLNRATLDSQVPEAHLAWMDVMELKELLDFQALMAILAFLDHLYASRSLYIIYNGFAFLKVLPFSPIWISLSIYGATTVAPCLTQKSVLTAPQHWKSKE